MNENIITVTGNLCAAPEQRETRNGVPMLTFRVASTHRYYSNRTGQWEEGVANFYDVVAYRQLANNAGKSLHKGDAVFLQGQFKQRRYERQDGSFGMACEIEARLIGPDLAHGVAAFTRSQRPANRSEQNGGQNAASNSAQDSGQGFGQNESAPPWVNPDTGEITDTSDNGLINADITGFDVDKDHEERRSFAPRDGSKEGADSGDDIPAEEGELVGAND